jgi:hypothetical protein
LTKYSNICQFGTIADSDRCQFVKNIRGEKMEFNEQIREINNFFRKYKTDIKYYRKKSATRGLEGENYLIDYRTITILVGYEYLNEWVWPMNDKGKHFKDWKDAFIYAHKISEYSGFAEHHPLIASILCGFLIKDFDIDVDNIYNKKILAVEGIHQDEWKFIQ